MHSFNMFERIIGLILITLVIDLQTQGSVSGYISYDQETYNKEQFWDDKSTNLQLKTFTYSMYYMNDFCNKPLILSMTDAILVCAARPGSYLPATYRCLVRVQNPTFPKYHLGITFKYMRMSQEKDGKCLQARLDLYNGLSTSIIERISEPSGICGIKSPSEQYNTTMNSLTMLITTNNLPYHSNQTFKLVITPFHTGNCTNDEFKCTNGRCIKNNTVCDTYDNCGDDSDETTPCIPTVPHTNNTISLAAILGIAVGGVILVAIAIMITCCCCCCSSKSRGGYESV